MKWVILKEVTVKRGNLEGLPFQTKWVPDATWGTFPTSRAAKTAYVKRAEPALGNSGNEDYIVKWFDAQARGRLAQARVGRLQEREIQ